MTSLRGETWGNVSRTWPSSFFRELGSYFLFFRGSGPDLMQSASPGADLQKRRSWEERADRTGSGVFGRKHRVKSHSEWLEASGLEEEERSAKEVGEGTGLYFFIYSFICLF